MSLNDPFSETFIHILDNQPADSSSRQIIFAFHLVVCRSCWFHLYVAIRFDLDIRRGFHCGIGAGKGFGRLSSAVFLVFLWSRRVLLDERLIKQVLIL